MDIDKIKTVLFLIVFIVYITKSLYVIYKAITYKTTNIAEEKYKFQKFSFIIFILFILIFNIP